MNKTFSPSFFLTEQLSTSTDLVGLTDDILEDEKGN